ncbi:hypothetical protein ACFY19_20745 [Streptosporangium saharense]|uniref:hypothetical protein n=1 Tax=Streptosporangium saharense TaxID=1706840 RepID=UPI0036D1D2D6
MTLPAITTPGAVIGYRRDGRPIRLIAGGSGEGDPTPDPADPTGEPVTDPSPTDPPADDKPETGKDGDDLAKWKAQARANETKAKANKAALDKASGEHKAMLDRIAEALGIKGKEEDPKVLADQLTTKLGTTEGDLRSARVELAVYKAAGAHGGDADALLDSRAFVKALGDLDPSDDGFGDAVAEAIKAAVKANPKLAAVAVEPEKKPPTRSGGDIPGAPSGGNKRAGGLAGAISNHYKR